ncbi:DUF3558 domain-containing protein [Nocardia sp. NPDC050193]
MVATAGRGRLVVALMCGAVLALTGCESSTEGAEVPATSTVAAEAPTGFDPCTDIPENILDAEGLEDPMPDKSQASGMKWSGCTYVQTDGYAASIRTTNITVDMVKDKGFAGTTEFAIGARRAIISKQGESGADTTCNVNVEMVGGSLEFLLDNPPSRDKTGHLDTCELARTLAEKVTPSIPEAA